MADLLTAVGVRKEFGGLVAVNDVDFTIPEGSITSLIGPNGAGKTTIARAVAGLVPYEGSVRLWGEEVSRLSRRDVAKKIAVVPQNPLIPPDMTVVDYVLLGRTPHIGYAASPGNADVVASFAALHRLEITSMARRRLGTLSGGESQRAVLARALAQEPRLVLLDEPTSALDVGAQQQVLELVSMLREEDGLTVLSAMHDLTLTSQYADELVLVDEGREVARGDAADVLTEELVARHYGASVRVIADEERGVAVVPVRQPRVEAKRPD
jgi:iron complex transport system ATP-binding protein